MDKRDTLYFAYYINCGSMSTIRAKELIVELMQQVNSKIKDDNQYREKWIFVPVRDSATRIELLYPPTSDAKDKFEERLSVLIDGKRTIPVVSILDTEQLNEGIERE